jgi:hypothetical protein
MGFFSARQISNNNGIELDDVSRYLLANELIVIEHGQWILTEKGRKIGGKVSKAKNGKEYILWPDTLKIELASKGGQQHDNNREKNWAGSKLLVSKIAEQYGIQPNKINQILSELGWIDKDPILGWRATAFGVKLGAIEKEHPTSGFHYVMWPKEILENKILNSVIEGIKAQIDQESEDDKRRIAEEKIVKFRQDLPGTYRTKDGHWVRSRAEVIIDDALYYYEIPHAYERKLPVEEAVYSDFYLPQVKVYIEFWGMEEDPKYAERKKIKREIYQKYNLDWIELSDTHIRNLDDHLPRMLLQYGVRVM